MCNKIISTIFSNIIANIKAIIGFFILVFNTVLCVIPFYIIVILKLLIPMPRFRRACTHGLEGISQAWVFINNTLLGLLHPTQWEVSGLNKNALSKKEWYFLICNHQSWVDVFVLQKILMTKIPPFKFFMKEQLLWIPLLGVVWWALDCPFMKRYSKAVLAKHPHLREVDLQTTQKKCLKFMHEPVTIFNFLEGTRFTEQKHESQHSRYKHLLNPKAGGLAYAMGAMQGKVQKLINVTIIYPKDVCPNFWNFLGGKLDKIKVHVELEDIPLDILKGDYLNNLHYQARFKEWVNTLWQAKDQLLDS